MTSSTTADDDELCAGSPGRFEKAKRVRRRGMQMQRMQSDQATTVKSTFAESRIADKSSRGLFGECAKRRDLRQSARLTTRTESTNALRTERLVDKVLAEEQDGVRSRRPVLIKLVRLHIEYRHHLGLERYRRL